MMDHIFDFVQTNSFVHSFIIIVHRHGHSLFYCNVFTHWNVIFLFNMFQGFEILVLIWLYRLCNLIYLQCSPEEQIRVLDTFVHD